MNMAVALVYGVFALLEQYHFLTVFAVAMAIKRHGCGQSNGKSRHEYVVMDIAGLLPAYGRKPEREHMAKAYVLSNK